MPTIEYDSNNSGGSWWLEDKDWYALEKAGWDVDWVKDRESDLFRSDGRFLGALATTATKDFEDPTEAIREFERITGRDASDVGCNCCGPQHNFSFSDETGHHYASGEVATTRISFE